MGNHAKIRSKRGESTLTRCYEFYVMVKNNPTRCDKSDSVMSRINQYMGFMELKGVSFDKSEMDKARFVQLQLDDGLTEKAVTQPHSESQDTVALVQEQPTPIQTPISEINAIQASNITKPSEICPVSPLRECAQCHMASRDTTDYKGETLCPSCLTEVHYKPDKKPVEPAIVTTSIIKPKDTWEQRKAQMQVPISKMETAVLIKLEQKGLHFETQKEFCLQRTFADYYSLKHNLAIYLDGEVHRGREDRDEAIREQLTNAMA